MITGTVSAEREAVIVLVVRDTEGGEHEYDAVVDTGFNGALSLPASVISGLGLQWRTRSRAELADEIEAVLDIYEGTVVWDGDPRRVAIHEVAGTPLVGMQLLSGYDLRIQVRTGGDVTIEKLSA
jgi:clan AA aspartic protease